MTAHALAPNDALPCSIEAEQALLGAILLNPDALTSVQGFLEGRHFSEPLHKAIYQAALDIAGSGRAPTLIAIGAELSGLDMPASAPPLRAYLARLAVEAPNVINARDYAEMIVDAWARRELIGLAEATAAAARAPGVGRLRETLDDLDAGVIGLRNAAATRDELDRSTLASGLADVIYDAEAHAAGDARPIPSTGFVDIDRAIAGGYRPGRLYVVAGRPGCGKTVFMCASARRVARPREGRPQFGVDIYSLEIDRRELSARMAANAMAAGVSPLDYSNILAGKIEPEDIERLRNIERSFSRFALTVDATPQLAAEQIEARAKRTKQRLERQGKTLDVVFVDYLQIMKFGERYRGRRVDEIGEATASLKAMSKRIEVAVVLLSQLSREVDKRDDKRPQLSDLRDSGTIEQDADVVIGLYRPAYYDQRNPKVIDGTDSEAVEIAAARANDLEAILLKNRLGPTKAINLYCDVARSFIDNGARQW